METQNEVKLTFLVNKNLKEAAESLFRRMGVSLNVALGELLRKAVEDGIEYASITKAESIGYNYSIDEISKAFENAVYNELKNKKEKGFPIARYDAEKNQAYLEASDGSREYVN